MQLYLAKALITKTFEHYGSNFNIILFLSFTEHNWKVTVASEKGTNKQSSPNIELHLSMNSSEQSRERRSNPRQTNKMNLSLTLKNFCGGRYLSKVYFSWVYTYSLTLVRCWTCFSLCVDVEFHSNFILENWFSFNVKFKGHMKIEALILDFLS